MQPNSPAPAPQTTPASARRPQAPAPATPGPSAVGGAYTADVLTAGRRSAPAGPPSTIPANLDDAELDAIATKKATCPFMAAAVKLRGLVVRNDAERPLARIDEVVALGNSGGGNLGQVLKLFAAGNHASMPGLTGAFDVPVPAGHFSLDFPGSQGSHPGHSGILQGDPAALGSGRFSQADLDRLFQRAQGGYLKRSDFGAFIAENLARDPHAKVADSRVALLLLADFGRLAAQTGPTLLERVRNAFTGGPDTTREQRQLAVALTKLLGEQNLVGSAGEFGLLMAFLANSPRSRVIGGEPALAVADVQAMFVEHRFPDGWETWPKTAQDWVANTTALTLTAGKAYHQRSN